MCPKKVAGMAEAYLHSVHTNVTGTHVSSSYAFPVKCVITKHAMHRAAEYSPEDGEDEGLEVAEDLKISTTDDLDLEADFDDLEEDFDDLEEDLDDLEKDFDDLDEVSEAEDLESPFWDLVKDFDDLVDVSGLLFFFFLSG